MTESMQKTENKGRTIFISATLLIVFIGLPLSFIGLIIGFIAKWYLLLWIGLVIIVVGIVLYFAGLIIGAGVATKDVEDSFKRAKE